MDDGTNAAILPDPRNDENLIIAGLQCAFILFHNNAVDWAREHGYEERVAVVAVQVRTIGGAHHAVAEPVCSRLVLSPG